MQKIGNGVLVVTYLCRRSYGHVTPLFFSAITSACIPAGSATGMWLLFSMAHSLQGTNEEVVAIYS